MRNDVRTLVPRGRVLEGLVDQGVASAVAVSIDAHPVAVVDQAVAVAVMVHLLLLHRQTMLVVDVGPENPVAVGRTVVGGAAPGVSTDYPRGSPARDAGTASPATSADLGRGPDDEHDDHDGHGRTHQNHGDKRPRVLRVLKLGLGRTVHD